MITRIHAQYVAVDTHNSTCYQAEHFLSSGCSIHKQPLELRNFFFLFVLHADCMKRFTDGMRLKQTLRTCVGSSVILCAFLKTYILLNWTNSLSHTQYVHKHALLCISQGDRWGKVSFEIQPIICVVIWNIFISELAVLVFLSRHVNDLTQELRKDLASSSDVCRVEICLYRWSEMQI